MTRRLYRGTHSGSNNSKNRQGNALPLFRYVIIGLMTVIQAGNANAQKPVTEDYLIQFTGNVAAAEKVIHAALYQQDPDVFISLSIELRQAKVRTAVQLDHEQLTTTLAPFGVQVESVMAISAGVPHVRMEDETGFGSFPKHVSTGNVDADNAAYQSAKAAWIEAHPDLYEQMLQGTIPPTAQPEE